MYIVIGLIDIVLKPRLEHFGRAGVFKAGKTFNYIVATSQSVEHGPRVGCEDTPGNFCEIFTL